MLFGWKIYMYIAGVQVLIWLMNETIQFLHIQQMISSEDNWAQQGEFVDFRDKDNNPWQVGYILSRTKNILKIRSEGWSSKFDEFLQLPTPARLRPFRTVVRGYTGQVKNPAMRQHWKFSSELQTQNQELLQDFLANISQKSEHEIKQFITGQHYFWIDFLLTVTYSTPEHLLQAYQYLKSHILFAKKYMEEMCDAGLSAWFGQNSNFNENQRAYRECFYQIIDGLYILTGINVRQLNFQKNNELAIKNATKENLTHEKYMTKFMLDNGLQKIYVRLLTLAQKETFEENRQLPVSFFYQLLHVYSTIQKVLLQKAEAPFNVIASNKQERKKLAIRLFTIIKKQIEYITPTHLKSHQNEKQLELLFSQINLTCYKYSLEQIAYEWIEKTKIKIAFLLIQCDTLERKLKGIQRLKDLYENLITVNQFQMFKLPYEIFIELLSDHRVVQSLYENNEHPEILKKGSELVLLLFKSHFIQISTLIYIWNASVQKHQAVKKIVYQLWIDLTPVITPIDIEKFIQPIIKCDQKMSEDQFVLFVQEWQIEMLINFGYNLMKQYEELGDKRESVDKIFTNLLQFIYKKILLMEKSNQLKTMVNNFAKIVNVTLLSNEIIKKAYISISKNQRVKLNLQLIISFYQQSFEKATYLPPNAIQIIFLAFQSPKNFIFSSTIFQLMDQIINFSLNVAGNYILSQQQFNNLWQIAHKSDEIKSQFYSWLVKKNSQGLFGVPIYQINANIPHELKSNIFKNFLCDFNKMDYLNMSIQELHIFKEFMLFENQQEDKIFIKRLMNLIKIPRIKNTDITGNKFMWDIFLNCKNENVIQELSKMILALHFNYHDSCDNETKKIRVNSLMVKLQKHLKDGLKKGNIKLMKHSLIILKDVIDFVKEKRQPKQIISNVHQNFKVMIKIFFQGKKYQQQIFFGSTFYDIKGKIAELIKLQRSKFQMFSMKNEEISLELSQIPFCFSQEMTIKVNRVDEDEQTIPSFVLNFTKDRIQNILIDMLEDQTICQSVYNVLQDIEVKVEQGEKLLEKLITISQKHMRQNNEGLSKQAVYIELFYIRIISFMLNKTQFLEKFIKNKLFNKLVDKLFVSLNNPLIILYFYSYMDIIFQILKKYKARYAQDLQIVELIQSVKSQLKQKSINVIDIFNDYLNNNHMDCSKIDSKKVRIIFTSLSIIDELENENFVLYFANHAKFNGIIRKIYLNNNANEVLLIFTEKIKKSLIKLKSYIKQTKDEEIIKRYEETISLFAKLYISDLFNEIQLKDGSYSDKKKILHYYKMVTYIISQLNSAQFNHYVLGQNNQQFNMYQLILNNLKICRDSSESTQPANTVLSANLIVLTAIYRKKPSLMTNQILHYIIYDCLFNKLESSSSGETNCKKIDNIKNALEVLQAGVVDTNSSKIISTIKNIQQFHKISYWRNSQYWSTSIQNEVKGQFVGLENLGCICYMNSLLQQLFMTKNFRNSILSLSLKDHPENERIQLLNAMKELFFNLIHSDQIALNPLFFIKTIKSHDNKPMIKIFVQMDIDEFCSILFDKVENQLQSIPNQINIVKNIFGGVYAHEIISKECKHCSERQEQFISIGLEVKKSILQSFNALIKGQMLDGQNKYYCEKCDKKVKAEKILTIKKLPPNLILSLKRFEYNYQIDAKIKINDYCQFPMQLNLKKYSQQQINKSQVPENLDISEQTSTAPSELPDSYFLYKLKGVVVHTGSADSGHYYSLIQDSENRWFEFNDSRVSSFSAENLADEAYGTKDSMEEKVKNAYLLFYERVQHEPELQKMAQLKQSEQNNDFVSKIINKNKTISKFRLLFSHDYSDFVDYLERNIKHFDLTQQEYQNWHQFLITYYLLIKIREGQIEDLLDLSKLIHGLITKDRRFSQLFLNAVTEFNFMEEVFVFGSNRDKIKVIGSLLTTAFFNYLADIPDNYNALKDTIAEKLLICITNLTIIHGNIYELQIFLRTVIESGKQKSDTRILKYLVEEQHFEKYLINNLLSFNIPKEEKQKAIRYKDEQKDAINPLLGTSKNEGKKYLPSLSKESWHILQLILQYFEPSQIIEEEVEQNQHLKNIKIQIEKVIKNGSLSRIIHECGVSRSIYRLYNVFKYLKKRQYLIEAIEKGLKDFESTKYRQLLLLLYFIVLDKQTSEKIILLIIDMLQKVQIVNEKYFIQVNLVHQWIINYINASPLFLKNLSENQSFLNKIINWIKAKPLPSIELIKKHKNPMNQKLSNRLNGILVSADPKDYDDKSRILKHKFTQILVQKIQLTGNSYDWQSQYLDKFTPQTDAFYFNHSSKSWNRVKILQNNFGYLKLQEYGESKTAINLWSDNQRLSPFKQNVVEGQQQLEQGSSSQSDQKMEAIDEQQDLYH